MILFIIIYILQYSKYNLKNKHFLFIEIYIIAIEENIL